MAFLFGPSAKAPHLYQITVLVNTSVSSKAYPIYYFSGIFYCDFQPSQQEAILRLGETHELVATNICFLPKQPYKLNNSPLYSSLEAFTRGWPN